MSDDTSPDHTEIPAELPTELPAAAQRALAEAAERRKAAEEALAKDPRAKEYGGRDGLDPARYGDWEKKGIAIDF